MSSKKFKKYSYFYGINQYLLCKNQFIPNISTPLLVITIISRNSPTVFFYRIFTRTVCNHKLKSKNHIRLKNNIVIRMIKIKNIRSFMIFVSNAMRYFISNRYACSKTIIWNFKICRITVLRFNIFFNLLIYFWRSHSQLAKSKS